MTRPRLAAPTVMSLLVLITARAEEAGSLLSYVQTVPFAGSCPVRM